MSSTTAEWEERTSQLESESNGQLADNTILSAENESLRASLRRSLMTLRSVCVISQEGVKAINASRTIAESVLANTITSESVVADNHSEAIRHAEAVAKTMHAWIEEAVRFVSGKICIIANGLDVSEILVHNIFWLLFVVRDMGADRRGEEEPWHRH